MANFHPTDATSLLRHPCLPGVAAGHDCDYVDIHPAGVDVVPSPEAHVVADNPPVICLSSTFQCHVSALTVRRHGLLPNPLPLYGNTTLLHNLRKPH